MLHMIRMVCTDLPSNNIETKVTVSLKCNAGSACVILHSCLSLNHWLRREDRQLYHFPSYFPQWYRPTRTQDDILTLLITFFLFESELWFLFVSYLVWFLNPSKDPTNSNLLSWYHNFVNSIYLRWCVTILICKLPGLVPQTSLMTLQFLRYWLCHRRFDQVRSAC